MQNICYTSVKWKAYIFWKISEGNHDPGKQNTPRKEKPHKIESNTQKNPQNKKQGKSKTGTKGKARKT